MIKRILSIGLPVFLIALLFSSLPAMAQTVSIDVGDAGDGTVTGRVVQLVALLTILSLAPGILMMMTSFP